MANRNFSRVQALNHEVKIIAGSFRIAASGGAASKLQGLGWSVVKTSAGVYTVTLEDKYVDLLSATATVAAETAVDLVPQVGAVDVKSARTVVVRLNAAAVPTEPTAVTDVHFVLHLRNSSVA